MSSPSRSTSQPTPHTPHSFLNSPLSTTTYSPHSTSYSPHSLGGCESDDGEGYGLMERGRREDTPPAPCSVLCGPRSCSTLPPSLARPPVPVSTDGAPNKGRRVSKFWGLRGLVKMFRRKVRRRGQGDSPGGGDNSSPDHSPQQPPTTMRARSASELLGDANSRPGLGPYNQGISVSHDSVFSPDSPPDPPPHHAAPVPLTLATRGVNMSELKAALRRRVVSSDSPAGVGGRRRGGEEDGSGDDDPGLPRSPPTSPTTLDVLNHGLKSVSRATQSTCSDGSLLSMGSSELEDDSPGSLHSSKHSLGDGRLLQVVDHEPVAGEAPGLNHTAARHKIAVKPRRTHALTRPRRPLQQVPNSSLLPPTLEVNEEGGGGRSAPHLFSAPVQIPSPYHPSVFGATPLSSQPLVTQPLGQHKMPPPPHFDPLNYHPDPHHLQHQGVFIPPQVSGGSPYLVGEPPPIVNQPSSQMDQRQQLMHLPPAADLDGPAVGDADRREEPLLSRLFGSVRAGRRRSRSRQDELNVDDREASVSPMRRDGRYSAPSTKARTESPAARVPLLSRSNSRGRQQLVQQRDGEYLRLFQQEEDERSKQIQSEQQLRQHEQQQQQQQQLGMHHQHQLQMKIKARSVENRKLDEKTDYETRSSSVEGRIEGHELEKQIAAHEKKPPLNFQIASYQERSFYSPVKNESSVKKAKSFREMGKPAVVVRRDSSRRSWFGHESAEYPHGGHSRLSASYDSLDDKVTVPAPQQQTPSQSVVSLVNREGRRSSAVAKAVLSPALSSTLSSTDSLTTTEIPGVYIRPLCQYKRGPSDDGVKTDAPSYFCTQQTQFSGYNDPIVDSSSGPLSLDSSITLIPRDEDNMRKTSSSDHVSANMVHVRKYSSENVINPAPKIIPVSSMPEHAYVCSASAQRKSSASGSSITEIQILPEYQGKFSSYVPGPASVLRSMSLSTSDTSATCGVLNRRASSADELEPVGGEAREMNSPAVPIRTRHRKRESSLSRASSQDPEPPSVPEFMRIQLNKVENKPQRVIYTTEDDETMDSFAAQTQFVEEENAQDNNSLKSKDSFNSQTEGEDEEAEPDNTQQRRSVSSRASRRESILSQSSQNSCAGDSSDDVVLRRPLRREKSLVMDSSSQVSKKEDEPELFKVFARRSFKVQESFTPADDDDEEEAKTDDSSEMMPSLSSQMTGVTKINPIYSTPTPPRTPIISSSFSNKFSVGSPTIPFKLPGPSSKESQLSSSAVLANQCTAAGVDVQLRSTSTDTSSFENYVLSASLAITEAPSVVHKSVAPKTEPTCTLPAKEISASYHVTTSAVASTVPNTTGKITIRPMSANREVNSVSSITNPPFPSSEPASSSSSSSFSSVIIGRMSSISPDHSRPNPSSTPPKPSVAPPTLNDSCATDSVTVNSNNVTPVSWPPKSFALKSSPLTSQVKSEQLGKYTTTKQNLEMLDNDTTASAPENDQEASSVESADTDETNVSQVQSVRRKFMTAGSSSSKSFTSPSSTLQSSTSSLTAHPPSVATASPPVIEARNTVPGFTVTVRSTQSPSTRHSSLHAASRSHSSAGSSPAPSVGSSSPAVVSHHRHSIGGAYVPHPRQRQPPSSSPSPPPPGKRSPLVDSDQEAPPQSIVPHSTILQSALSRHLSSPAASPSSGTTMSVSSVSPVPSGDGLESSPSGEDWRALVRQRREDRLKQSKSVESLDEPAEARGSGGGGGGGGSSSRSSKVLEMASNFQKLQVA